MFVSSKFRAVAILVLVGAVDPGALSATAEPLPPFRVAQGQPISPPPDANVLKIQEALVWTGYYEGPIDGSAGPGTQSAAKKFQRELGKPETGTLDDAQAAALTQRAQTAMQVSGYKPILDSRSGVRIGIPFLLASQKKNANAGTDYISPDGRIQIGLRVFRTTQELSAVFTQLKEKSVASSQLAYSTSRSNWFVLAGESATKKYYVRYHANRDLIAGFFSIHDKSLPKETNGPLVTAITIMSLTMQPFSADLSPNSVASLTTANLFEPISLAVGDSALDDHANTPAPAAAPVPRAVAPPAAVPAANPPRDDAVVLALQKRLAQMESAQQKLQQQLAAKDAEKKPEPPVAVKSWTPSYEMLGLLAGLIFLLVLLLGRRATGSKTAEPPKTPAPATEPSPVINAPPPQPVVVTHEAPVVPQQAPTVVPPPPPPPPVQPVATAASGRGGFAVVVAMGGMVAVVLVIAFLVEKISSVTGF